MERCYHGGPAGRKVGDWLLPPAQTGQRSCADAPIRGAEVCNRGKVYVTPSLAAAVMFASAWPEPRVYLCEPENPSHDPDCAVEGLSFECDRARVVRVIKPKRKHIDRCRRALMSRE